MCSGCRYCYTAAKGRDRSVWLTLLASLFVLASWPAIGILQIQDFPYPLTMAMIIHMIIMLIGVVLYMVECCVRGIDCFPKKDPNYELDEPSLDEEGEEKGPLSCWMLAKRMVHWAMFSGLFLTIFIYASTIAQAPCQSSPNLCTMLFRSSLFLTCVMSLAAIRAERRGGRFDWFVAGILSVGITLLLWNHSPSYRVDFQKEFGVLVGGALVMLSFSVVLISLRRGVQGSSIAKTVWIQSVYGFITMVGLAAFFEGAAPWQALAAGGFGLIWRVLAVIGICILWDWFTVMSLAFSETILVALTMQFSLLFGDMGIHQYIFATWQFSAKFIVGLVFVLIGFLWMLKRMITLNCPNMFGTWCDWGDKKTTGEDLNLLSDDEDIELPAHKPNYNKAPKKKYGEQYPPVKKHSAASSRW